MNKARRKQIQDTKIKIEKLISVIEQRNHSEDIEDLKAEFEEFRDDEQEYFDNMPESLQGGEKGSSAEQAISSLESIIEALDSAQTAWEELIEFLGEAKELEID